MEKKTLKANGLGDEVVKIASKVSGLSESILKGKISQPLAKLGIDSLMALSVVAAAERRFKINIAERQMKKLRTLQDLALLISKNYK